MRIVTSRATVDPGIHFAFRLTFKRIREVLVWDNHMEHVYFMVGDTVLRQVNGLPMGSPPSPVLANLTCGLGYELEYINRMESWGRNNMGN